MSISHVNDVEFGAELPAFEPDTRLATGAQFAELIGWGGARFTDHEGAKKGGPPGSNDPRGHESGFPRRNDPSLGTRCRDQDHRHGLQGAGDC